MKSIDVVAAILLVVGGLNWGLVGFLGFDLVETVWAMEWLIPRLMVTEDETPDGVMVSGQYTSEPLRLTEAGKAFARRGEVPRGW